MSASRRGLERPISMSVCVGLLVWSAAWVLPVEAVEAPELQEAFNTYLGLTGAKAFAVAEDDDGAWTAGYSSGHNYDSEAVADALKRCNSMLAEYGVNAPCEIVAQGIELVDRRDRREIAASLTIPTDSRIVLYDKIWVEGIPFFFAKTRDLQVWMVFAKAKDPFALVYLVNGSSRPITFVPESIQARSLKITRKKSIATPLKTFSAREFEKKVRNREAWMSAFHAMAVALANQPGAQTSTFNGSYNGSYSTTGAPTYARGTYTGTITRWPSSADYAAAYERTAAQVQAMSDQLSSSFESMASTLMWTHTMQPESYYGGIVHFERFKGDQVWVKVPFASEVFEFGFSIR